MEDAEIKRNEKKQQLVLRLCRKCQFFRAQHGLTQEQLATKFHVPVQCVSRVETKSLQVSYSELSKLSTALQQVIIADAAPDEDDKPAKPMKFPQMKFDISNNFKDKRKLKKMSIEEYRYKFGTPGLHPNPHEKKVSFDQLDKQEK